MFLYKNWEIFCRELNDNRINSVTACSLLNENVNNGEFLVLKHDVENNLSKALVLAEIESKYSHKGTYYIQGYLIHDKKNIEILKKIKSLGHEISYHHDVMDSNMGDISKARLEFIKYKSIFEENGFPILTVCQHGNPIVERNGYTSNRDFFRNNDIRNEFSHISEIMVNYKERIKANYLYISDAGYGWKVIFDPENNDIVDSNDKNIPIKDLRKMVDYIVDNSCMIISTHPHRWHHNKYYASIKNVIFKLIKVIVKSLIKVPHIKKIFERYYFLAKKI